MPIDEEMFFAVRDCKAEQELIADSELRVVESVVGHSGLFGFEEGCMEQIDRHFAELLETPVRPAPAILGTGTAEACSSNLALSQPLQLTPMLVVALAIHIEVVVAALEHGDGFGRQRSPTGELLLRQPGGLAQPPEPSPNETYCPKAMFRASPSTTS